MVNAEQNSGSGTEATSEVTAVPSPVDGVDSAARHDGGVSGTGDGVGLDPVPVEIEPSVAGQIFGEALSQARQYSASLVDAGVVRGLIGPREPMRIWSRHVLNCAVAAPLLPAGSLVVDVGSGAGLPGIPMALARPDCRFLLVEPLERRCIYLTEVVEELGLADRVMVIRGRADQVAGSIPAADIVTSRAVAPLAKLLGWSIPLVRPGGELMILKGASAGEEIKRDKKRIRGIVDLRAVEVGSDLLGEPTYVVRGGITASARVS